MISGSTYTFGNAMTGAFVTSQGSQPPFISFQTVTQMGDIWTVTWLFFLLSLIYSLQKFEIIFSSSINTVFAWPVLGELQL